MTRVDLNIAGFRRYRRSPEVAAMLKERGLAIAARAGDGMAVQTVIGANRARVTIRTATYDAMVAEATDRSLSRALDAGR